MIFPVVMYGCESWTIKETEHRGIGGLNHQSFKVVKMVSKPMGFSRQEYWSGLPFPSPGDVPSPGIEPGSPAL